MNKPLSLISVASYPVRVKKCR